MATMKFLCSLLGVFFFSMNFCSDHIALLAEFKADLLMRAGDFAQINRKVVMQPIFWEQAYTAYVFNQLKNESLSIEHVMQISQRVKSKSLWEAVIASEEDSMCHKILSCTDQNILPYYKSACTQWGKQQASLEQDWKEFASRYVANNN